MKILSKPQKDKLSDEAFLIALEKSSGLYSEVLVGLSAVAQSTTTIINGRFDVWQRGGGAFTSNGDYTADRWLMSVGTSSLSVTQEDFTLGQTDVPGNPDHYLQADVTSSAGSGAFAIIRQRIEGAETLSGQAITISFYAKADGSKDIALELSRNYGTGGSPSSTDTSVEVETISLTDSWARYAVKMDVPSISGKTLGNNDDDYVELLWWLDAGSDFDARTNSLGQQDITFDIANVQIDVGSTALPWRNLNMTDELFRCFRYYYRITHRAGAQTFVSNGVWNNSNTTLTGTTLPAPMRALPTVGFSALSDLDIESEDEAPTSLNSIYADEQNRSIRLVFGTGGGGTAGNGAHVVIDTAGGWVEFEAEL